MATNVKFTKAITINNADADVVFDGCDFTEGAFIIINAAKSVKIVNCRFYGYVPDKAKCYQILINGDIAMQLIIENNFFGNYTANGTNKVYSLLELNAKLKTGSSITNNYFAKNCCSHNTINIYGADDNATITIGKNKFEFSDGTIRIGVKAEPKCTIEMNNNTVMSIDKTSNWAGLVTLQPYGAVTTSFANMTINMTGNVGPYDAAKIIYYFFNATDLNLTDATLPKVFVNGKAFTMQRVQ